MELIVRIVLLAGVLFISNRVQSSFGSIHMSLWSGDGGAGTVDQMAGSAASKVDRAGNKGMGLGKKALFGGAAGAYLFNKTTNRRSKKQTAATTNALGGGGQQNERDGQPTSPSTAVPTPSFKSRVMSGVRSVPRGVSTWGGKVKSAWKNRSTQAHGGRLSDRAIAQRLYDQSDGTRSVQSLTRGVAFDRRKRAALNAKNKAMYGLSSFKDKTLKKFDNSKFARTADRLLARSETSEKYKLKRQERRANGQTYFSSKVYQANKDAAYANGERFASVKGAFRTVKDELTERRSVRKNITDDKFKSMRQEMAQYRKEHSAKFDSSYIATYNEVNAAAQSDIIASNLKGENSIDSGNWKGSPRELRRKEKAANRQNVTVNQGYMGGE